MKIFKYFLTRNYKGRFLELIRFFFVPKSFVRKVRNFPLKLSLNPMWAGDMHFLFYGSPYKEEFAFIKSEGPYEGNILDVGANMGSYALFFSTLTKHKVYAFEPVHTVNLKLQENIAVNKLENSIKTESLAISDKKGTADIFVDGNYLKSSGESSLLKQKNKLKLTVPTVTLDEYCKSLGKISLIKIDIEGYELNALKGAVKTIRKYSPKIYFEVTLSNFGNAKNAINKFESFFKPLGYSLYFVEGDNKIPLREATIRDGNWFAEKIWH